MNLPKTAKKSLAFPIPVNEKHRFPQYGQAQVGISNKGKNQLKFTNIGYK